MTPSHAPGEAQPAPSSFPAGMHALRIDSHGCGLLGVLYTARGPGPHPTVIVLHGFPGNERNFDLAHLLRQGGYNSVVVHYRGSWGSAGTFSFEHCLQDVEAVLAFLRDPAHATTLRVDPRRLALVGHSMGGFAALMTAARDTNITATASLAGFNFGAHADHLVKHPEQQTAWAAALHEELAPLRGATGQGLLDEYLRFGAAWNVQRVAPAFRARHVLLLAGTHDAVAAPALHHAPLVTALQNAAALVSHDAWPTDHNFSERRQELGARLLAWLAQVMPTL